MSSGDKPLEQGTTDKTNSLIPCAQRAKMLLCPCIYLDQPKVATRDCCLCGHELKLEDKFATPPLVELSGTWIGGDPIPNWFFYVRTVIAVFMIYALVFGFTFFVIVEPGHPAYYVIYLSIWTHILCTISMIVKWYATYKLYKNVGKDSTDLLKPIENGDPNWRLYNCNSILVQMSVPSVAMVAITFWVFMNPTYDSQLHMIDSIQIHAINCVLIWLDFFLSAQRMYYKGMSWCFLYVTVYIIWSIIFEIFINVNHLGDPYIYPTLDWSAGIRTPTVLYFVIVVLVVLLTLMATCLKNILLLSSGIPIPSIRTHVIDINQGDAPDESSGAEANALLVEL